MCAVDGHTSCQHSVASGDILLVCCVNKFCCSIDVGIVCIFSAWAALGI